MEFHQRLKDIRTDKDMSQTDFGTILNMTQRKISRLERKNTEPTPAEIKNICNKLNISADYLLGLTDTPRRLK